MIRIDTKYIKPPASTTTDSNDLIKNIHRILTWQKKENLFQNVKASYEAALNDYISCHRYILSDIPFVDPYNNFCYYNDSVHYNFNTAFPFENNTQRVFTELFHLPCSIDQEKENALLHALKNLLKQCKALPKSLVLLAKFEEKNHFKFPGYNFFILDSTLCLCDTISNPPIYTAVTQNSLLNLNADFANLCLNNITLLKALKTIPSILPFSHFKAQNPYYVNLKSSNQLVAIKYDPEQRIFQFHRPIPEIVSLSDLYGAYLPNNHLALEEKTIPPLLHFISLNSYTDLRPTDRLTNFLCKLTNGNFQNLTNLAILFANIASPEILTPKLFLVSYSNKEIDFPVPEYFSQLLDLIFNLEGNGHFSKEYPTIGKLVQKQIVPDIANNIFEGTKLLYVEKSSSSLSDAQLKKLKQYLKGSKVTGTDKKFGSVSFRNTNPIICFSNNQKELTYLEQNLPCVRINLDFIDAILSLETPDPYQYFNDYEWLRICLPLYGVYLLAEKKYHHQPLPKNKKLKPVVSTDTVTGDFLNICCVLSANDFVYTDELYSAYCFYYQNVHNSEPLKRTQFVKSLKQISGLTYKRPHTSRNEPNKYAFAGVALCPDWKEKVLSSVNSLSLEESAFKAKLEEITALVPDLTT